MEKNQIWAIVLSTIILSAYFFFIAPRFQQKKPTPQSEVLTETVEEQNVEKVILSETEEAVEEQTYTITTNKVKVTFTNKGGDIIGFELLDHIDKDTQKGVELADSISANNRSCALSFGGAESPIINDFFSFEQVDKNTVLFTKRYNDFTLGKRYSFLPDEYMFKMDGNEKFALQKETYLCKVRIFLLLLMHTVNNLEYIDRSVEEMAKYIFDKSE